MRQVSILFFKIVPQLLIFMYTKFYGKNQISCQFKDGIFMIRLDKYLCDMSVGTRSIVKDIIRKGNVSVNNIIIKSADVKIEEKDIVKVNGNIIDYQSYFYYMLNKPAGFVSATTDKKERTVMELLNDRNRSDLFPIGRLDKDTEGLLILSNDGELAHKLLSPKNHIPKTYLVVLKEQLLDIDKIKLESGINIGEKKNTLPAIIQIIEDKTLFITITEGKFHQIKRMFEAISNKVTYLKRISMGDIVLDEKLGLGEFRELTQAEINCLKYH